MTERNNRALLNMIASMLIFGTIGIFRRYIPLSSSVLACTRGFLGSLVLMVVIKIQKRKLVHGIGMKKVIALALTGGLMGANWILLFEAYRYTSVPKATLCYYMQPTIVILLSPILFKEHLTFKKLVCALISLIGMVFVSGLAGASRVTVSDLRGIIYGLTAAVLYASVVILNKFVSIEDAYEKTILQLFCAAVILLPYLILSGQGLEGNFQFNSVIMLLIVGLIHTGLAYVLYFGSMVHLNSQTIAQLGYIDPVSALIFSALFLGEKLSVFGLFGAVLIIGSAMYSEYTPAKKTVS